jgi:NAD(P)-dependent dehydrogenase (short-subunit alcohol dehydrogenase family)
MDIIGRIRRLPQIRVNAIGPGYIETDLNQQWLADPDNLAYVEHHTPLKRVGTPEDVAGVVRFLASAEAAYITGQHVLGDGGWHTP